MENFVKNKALLAVLLLIVGCLLSCSAKKETGGPVEVTFWYSQSGPLGDVLLKLVDEFNASHPQYRVKAVSMGNYTALSQKIMAAIQAGNQPELSMVFESWSAGMAKSGVLYPMEDFIKNDPDFKPGWQDDFYPVFLEANKIDGKLYTFPFNKSVRVIYYNKDMLFNADLDPNTPPATWQQFRDYCKLLTKDENHDGNPEVWGTTISVSSWQFGNMLMQAGGQLISNDLKTPQFACDEGVEALVYLHDLLYQDKSAYLSTGFSGQDDFLAGKVAFVEGSSVSMAFLKNKKIPFFIGVGALPTYKTGKSLVSGTNVAIFKNDDQQKMQASWEFVKWFTGTTTTARWAAETYYMPVRRSAFNEPTLKTKLEQNPEMRSVFSQLEQAWYEPPLEAWFKSRKELEEKVIEQVVRNPETDHDVLQKFIMDKLQESADEMKQELQK